MIPAMRATVLLALLLASCGRPSLDADLARMRAEIEALERELPADSPLWITEGENAFARHLDDRTARVPDFIYNHVLSKIAKSRAADLEAQVQGDFDAVAALKDPDAARGRFWKLRGVIGSLRSQGADADAGVREVQAGLVWINEVPVLFHLAEKPEIVRLGEDVVELSGVFVKILQQRTRSGGTVEAPFFLAKSLRKYY